MPLVPVITSAELSSLWRDNIFSRVEITRDYTPNVYSYDVTATQESSDDLAQLVHLGEINFIQYFVRRYRQDDQLGCCGRYIYQVQVQYYREDLCDNQTKIQAFFELLDDLVHVYLGPRWLDSVKQFSREQNFPDIRAVGTINGRVVYAGTYNYTAEATPDC